jgi:dolichyl-phosphate mannosyltransferase polypeptide 3
MLRITRVLACISAILAAWIAALFADLPLSTQQVVFWAPFAAVAAFGLYSIVAVLYGVFTFRDCPEEAASLHKDIERARADLIKRGVLNT